MTAIVVLCILTWAFLGLSTWWLLTMPSHILPRAENTTTTPFTTSAPAATAATTPAATPMISGVSVDVSDSSAVIVWTTNVPSSSIVEFWEDGSNERTIKENKALETSHRMIISGLKSETKYWFQARSAGGSGMEASQPGSFDTIALAALESPEVGYTAPEFTIKSTAGESVTLSSYRGKWVMLVFWDTSCSVCREQMPDLQTFSTRMPADKMTMITVNVANKNEAILASFLKSREITLPVLLDADGAVKDNYKIAQYPTTFYIDSTGIIRLVYDHGYTNVDQIAGTIASLLGN